MNRSLDNNTVDSRSSFVEFVNSLHQEFITHPNKWENNTLESFLEAMSRYAEDLHGYYDNTNQALDAEKASWQNFANILRGATLYE